MCVFWHNVLRLKKVIYKHCCAICVLEMQGVFCTLFVYGLYVESERSLDEIIDLPVG